MDGFEISFLQLKFQKKETIDELWIFTQNYLDQNSNYDMECKDELELLKELEFSNEFKNLIEKLNSTQKLLNQLYIKFLNEECSSNLKKDKITALKEKFQDRIRTSEIVIAVGCSKSYAMQFYLIDGKIEQKENRRAISTEIKKEIMKRDNYSCVVCGELKDLEIHHILAIRGSSIRKLDDHENLATLCKECHHLAHKGDYNYGLAYENSENFWEWTQNIEKTKMWLILKDIHGIGLKITENIYDKYKSVEELQNADIRSLTRIRLVNKSMASKIKFKLNS